MKKRLIGSILSAVVLATCAVGAWDADFEPSSYNPDVDEIVTFAICEPCLDGGTYTYRWDFDGDGALDLETERPTVEHVFTTAGFYEVELTLVDELGRRKTGLKGILVGRMPAYAVRETVEQGDGTTFVLITVHVGAVISVPAFQESMPRGWQFEILDDGGALTRMNSAERLYEVVWMSAADEVTELTFSYRLHPTNSSGPITPLDGTFSGYMGSERFSGPICGELTIEH